DTRQLHGRPLAGSGGRVSELPRRDDEGETRAAGPLIRRLEIAWPKGARRLSVLLLPDCNDGDQALPIAPLEHWLAGSLFRLAGDPQPLYGTQVSAVPRGDLQTNSHRRKPVFSGKHSRMRINHA